MSDIAIRVENLSKQYRIGGKQERYKTLRDTLTDAFVAPFRRVGKLLRGQATGAAELDEIIWALKDISLEVKHGEVVGIIGGNGAGKSTLLKILTRITEPTEGKAEIHGRVGSLLEVGTGFHPELTGRENIYLNGAILGMRREEIDRKFDEIVAFAEVERFIDTPVKHYSSGMYLRLAFAVAAHLEPEILLIDEVLTVGDAAFQKKCLGKIGDVAKEGRTVLFVSHNLIALQSICQRTIWIHDGQIKKSGVTANVISNYIQSITSLMTEQVWDDVRVSPGNEVVHLHKVKVRPNRGTPVDPITMQKSFKIEVEFWNLIPNTHLYIMLHLYTEQQIVAFTTGSFDDSVWGSPPLPVGLFRCVCQIPGNLLNSGIHRILLLVIKDGSNVIYRHEDVLSFNVLDLDKRCEGWYGKEPGVVQPKLKWTTEQISNLVT